MTLYVEQQGSGPDLVMIHGWGLHGGVWQGVVDNLAQHFRLHLVDLPGFGRSAWQGKTELRTIAREVIDATPTAHWLGWSMGGLVALRAALDSPEKVTGLSLLTSNPCFVARDDWPGIDVGVLSQFAAQLEEDYQATLMRFLSLQSRGSERAREEIKKLRATLFDHGEPELAALRNGLRLLAETDLRAALAQVSQRTILIAGDRDTLIPLAAMQATQVALPNAELYIIEGAGHAPFISHPEQFIEHIKKVVRE